MIDTYGDRLFRTALAITQDSHVAEEVVQDTFLGVCRKIQTFRHESSLYTWMLSICANLARNRLRGWWLLRTVPVEHCFTIASEEDGPECRLIEQEEQQYVIRCLGRLPHIYREVLVLHYIDDLSVMQIASVLRQPEGTVKSRLSRARTLLKQHMKERLSSNGR